MLYNIYVVTCNLHENLSIGNIRMTDEKANGQLTKRKYWR